MHKGRENSKLQDLQRHVGSGECVKAKGCQRHCLDMCGVAQHADDTPRAAWAGLTAVEPGAGLAAAEALVAQCCSCRSLGENR